MATIKYSGNKGDKYFDIVRSAGSAVTRDVELTYNDTVKTKELLLMIRKLEDRITKDGSI